MRKIDMYLWRVGGQIVSAGEWRGKGNQASRKAIGLVREGKLKITIANGPLMVRGAYLEHLSYL